MNDRREPPRRTILQREVPGWLMASVPILMVAGILASINALDARYLHAEAFATYQYQMQLQHQRDSIIASNTTTIFMSYLASQDSIVRHISRCQVEPSRCR